MNAKTANKINDIGTAVAMGMKSSAGGHLIKLLNIHWMSKTVGRMKGTTKDDIRDWCHGEWENLPQIPNLWEKVISRGPRKGQREYGVNDAYDALCIAKTAQVWQL